MNLDATRISGIHLTITSPFFSTIAQWAPSAVSFMALK